MDNVQINVKGELKMKLGKHFSISGGMDKAIDRAIKIKANALQIFTKSPRSWQKKILKEEEIKKMKDKMEVNNIKSLVVHSSYLINLASPQAEQYKKSIDELKRDYKQAGRLKADYYVFHPGSYLNSSKEEGIKRIIKALKIILDEVKNETVLLAENTAGAGTQIGSQVDELGQILKNVDNFKRLGICIDLCHLFVAGYNLSHKRGINHIIKEVNSILGVNNLRLIHLNDSKFAMGSNKDRHAHIGQGKISLDSFSYIINHPLLKDKVYIIETPGFNGVDKDIQTILKLKGE